MSNLAEADYDLTESAFTQGHDQAKGDDQLFVRFFKFAHPDEQETQKAGRPIYKDRDYIEIIQPGNKENIVHRPAYPKDQMRFPKQWQAYKNNTSQEYVEGTPLKEWTKMTPSMLREMEYFNIHTVEQLANLSDANTQQFMGLNKWKQDAQAYLAAAGVSEEASKIAKEMDDLKQENVQLGKQVEELAKQVEKLTPKDKK